MDFMNRGGRPVQQNTQTQTSAPDASNSIKTPGKSPNLKDKTKLFRIAYVAFFGLLTIVIVLVIAQLLMTKDTATSEAGNVDKSKFQAVFLNGGQVYFGKIDELNSKYLSMDNIYYLRVNQQVQPDANAANAAANDISLVKLGCELHGPQDSMVINQSQVIFWENLKDDGQVAKAVAEYVKANPNGQKCDEQQSTNTNTPAPATGTTTNTGTGAATNR